MDLLTEDVKVEIAAYCKAKHVQQLAIFGSALRDDFTDNSDIDVLVQFIPGHTPGLAFFTMQDELSELLGRPVDLHTPASLSKYFRDEVLAEAEPIYVAA